jgi:hypothetical protein
VAVGDADGAALADALALTDAADELAAAGDDAAALADTGADADAEEDAGSDETGPDEAGADAAEAPCLLDVQAASTRLPPTMAMSARRCPIASSVPTFGRWSPQPCPDC